MRARLTPDDLDDLLTATRPDGPEHYIQPCEVLHYTRRCPDTGIISSAYRWSRTAWPAGTRPAWSPWCHLDAPSRSSDRRVASAKGWRLERARARMTRGAPQ